MPDGLLQMRGIRKSFGGVEVLKGVDFDVRPGEVHAVCGENGAGKSTLMNIIAGVHSPDEGEIRLGEQNFAKFASAHAAQRLGISIVFQERSLFGPLTVAENIFAGRQPVTAWGMINRRQLYADADRLLAEVAPDVMPDAVIADLSPAQQQMVEIAKALSLDARVMIFDEPTAALTGAETTRLFGVIRQLRHRGVGVVYISHRLEEIFTLADRVTVLKDGACQGTVAVSKTNTADLIRRMVGRDVEKAEAGAEVLSCPVLFEVKGLSDPSGKRARAVVLKDVSFQAGAGEIVGLAGLAGAGRTETALTLFGVRPRGAGEIWLGGKRVEIRSPAHAIAAGLGYVSEDRKESGLFLDMSVRRNISAARLHRFGAWFFRDREEFKTAQEFAEKLRIICRDVEQDTGHLSGGNQQKVLLARWLLVNPRVLIVDEPTRGVDVGAKAEVHQLLRDFARQGHAIVMISSELPEVLKVSDRIYVMRAGQMAGELRRAEATEEAVMRLAAGGSD
jgi:ABC-type sugar transport system ATPase subunit